MQDRYVADVGDFGKYALLRYLIREAGVRRLAIVWCHYPDEGHNGDGKYTSYLRKAKFRALDEDLFETLSELVKRERRSLAHLEATGILGANTIYFRETLRPPGVLAPALRLAHRNGWRQRALRATAKAELVFFDPDNGLQTPSVAMNQPKSGKYVFWEDLLPFWERGQSLVVYHHLNRTMPVTEQVSALERAIKERLNTCALSVPMVFRRGSCRVFWIIGQQQHASGLRLAAADFLVRGWQTHFHESSRRALSGSH